MSTYSKKTLAPWYRLPLLVVVIATFIGLLAYAFVMREDIKTSKIDAPLISAPDNPVKRRPDQPGGMEIPNRDKLVFDLLTSDVRTGTEKSLPTKQISPKKTEIVAPKIEKPIKKLAEIPKLKMNLNPAKPAKVPEKTPNKTEMPEPAPSKLKAEKTPKPTGWGVQLASFVNKADAIAAQKTYLKTYSGILSNNSPNIEKISLSNGKGTRYRVQFFKFTNKTAAISACKKLKAKRQGCLYIKR